MYTTLKERNDGSVNKYRWPARLEKLLPEGEAPLPPIEDRTWKVVDDLEGAKKVLTTDAAKFTSRVAERQKKVVEPILRKKWVRALL